MFTRHLHYTQSHLMLLPINVFNSFLRDSFEMTTGEHYQLTLYMWMMNKSCIEFFVQKLNHNYTPFVSFLFEFSIFCSSTLLANKGSSRGSNPCRMGSSGSKEQLSSRTTLVKSSPCRSWWRFRMGRVVDMSRCKGPKYIIYVSWLVYPIYRIQVHWLKLWICTVLRK